MTLAARYGEIPLLQVWRLPELASLKPLLPMVAYRQRNRRPKGLTVTRSLSQLLTDADPSTQAVVIEMLLSKIFLFAYEA